MTLRPGFSHRAMTSLFGETLDEPSKPTRAAAREVAVGPFAGVALEQGIDRVLDYQVPKAFQSAIKVGQRVRVPLGSGGHISYVARHVSRTAAPSASAPACR